MVRSHPGSPNNINDLGQIFETEDRPEKAAVHTSVHTICQRGTSMSDTDTVYFPEPHEIEKHARAFARMMFEHAAFEREVRELQDAIMREHGFAERRGNQWRARDRPDRMVELIEQRLGQLPETESIKKLLKDAIEPSDQRNLLAHGTWWCFNRRASAISVRGTTRWESASEPPERRDCTVVDISSLADRFEDLAADLYTLRREIERPWIEEQVQGKA
jgi:hypothetical protein